MSELEKDFVDSLVEELSKNSINTTTRREKTVVGIVTFLLWIGELFFSAFVLLKYWGWFIMPATGWNPINYWLAMGINATISLYKPLSSSKKEQDCWDKLSEAIIWYILIGIFLGLGALISLGV